MAAMSLSLAVIVAKLPRVRIAYRRSGQRDRDSHYAPSRLFILLQILLHKLSRSFQFGKGKERIGRDYRKPPSKAVRMLARLPFAMLSRA